MQQLEKSVAKTIAEYGKKMNTAKQESSTFVFKTNDSIIQIDDKQRDSLRSMTPIHSHYSRLTTSIVLNDDDDNYYSRLTTFIVPEERQLEEVLIKQEKQICALYEILKGMNKKLLLIQGQFKKQNKDKDNNLSLKVFSEGYNTKLNKVREFYNRLYDNNDNSIENISKYAFPSISEDNESFNDIYTYTATVCDIVLNPEYPDLECVKKPLERRF
ncbi:10458_t:CDS:2 [Funneliformis mosseae]|uniref:10458_t:CDS:1 n=1 Tax=Funneliformis mosseae TaxID=27381 RepID=A0A9N9G9E0_FUNMO|nr:10458_t:CDS:2 [Funneliformis mosseae]